MNKHILFGAAILLAIVVFAAHWFSTHFEWREIQVQRDISPAARRNPYLAAEVFLNHLGIPAESITGREKLTNLPSTDEVLLLHGYYGVLPPERFDALNAWIEAGGHLIITARDFWDGEAQTSHNQLLDYYGIRLHFDDDEDEEETLEFTELNTFMDAEQHYQQLTQPIKINFGNYPEPVQVRFNQYRYLEDSFEFADVVIGEVSQAQLLQLELGEGLLTVLSDDEFLRNRNIGKEDHALFLGLLVEDSAKVWLLYDTDMPALPVLLWQRAPFLIVSLLAFLVLLIGLLKQRSGPLLAASEDERRNLLEHLDAAASYAWRVDHGHEMFAHSQAAIEHAWRRQHLGLEAQSRVERCAWIALRCGLSAADVQLALYDKPHNEQSFAQISAKLQILAAKLSQPKEAG